MSFVFGDWALIIMVQFEALLDHHRLFTPVSIHLMDGRIIRCSYLQAAKMDCSVHDFQ